jgi:crotonobetainyl-CoA:carnitine CoA-transferase CaiB-like acyl-CoA transferase
MARYPLDGIRVIDLTMGFAGPLATKVLGGMGAEVIKVESIQRPDWWRGRSAITGPDDVRYEQSPRFNTPNLYKQGITLNLTDRRGVAIFQSLVEIGDVVIENYSARVMKNFGLEYDTIRSWRPDVIMVSMPGFGATGPWRDYVAFGQTVEAVSGLTYFNGYPGEGPRLLSNGADPMVGVNAAVAVLIALLHRRRTGEGQFVELAQIEAITPFIGPELLARQMGLPDGPRLGNSSERMAPHGIYRCRSDELGMMNDESGTEQPLHHSSFLTHHSDRWVAIAVESDEQWFALCRVAGHEEWAADRRFATTAGRIEHREELDGLIGDWTVRRERHEIMRDLQEAGIAAGPVLSGEDLRWDPQLRQAGFFQALDRRHVGVHEYPLVPIRMSGMPRRDATPAPLLGEHNDRVLEELLGLPRADVADLRAAGVIGDRPVPRG